MLVLAGKSPSPSQPFKKTVVLVSSRSVKDTFDDVQMSTPPTMTNTVDVQRSHAPASTNNETNGKPRSRLREHVAAFICSLIGAGIGVWAVLLSLNVNGETRTPWVPPAAIVGLSINGIVVIVLFVLMALTCANATFLKRLTAERMLYSSIFIGPTLCILYCILISSTILGSKRLCLSDRRLCAHSLSTFERP